MAELFHVLMKAFSVRLLEAHGESFKETNGSKKVLTRLDISLSAGFLSPLCPVCIGLMLHSLFLDFLSKYLHITIKSKGRRSYFRTQGYHLYQTLTDIKQLFSTPPNLNPVHTKFS